MFKIIKLMCVLLPIRFETLEGNKVLQLDPMVDGVFKGPYPIGIDPVNTFYKLFELPMSFIYIYPFKYIFNEWLVAESNNKCVIIKCL